MAQKPNQGLDESTRSHLAGIAVHGVNRPVEWFEKKKGLLMFFICRLAPKLKERFTLAPPFYIFLFSPVCCLLQFIVEANFNLFRHRYTLQLRSPQISLLITFKTCALET